MTFKIKLGDKAAFINRMEKQGEAVGSGQIKDNKLESYFEIEINNPKQLETAKAILKQSSKINTLTEMANKLTKDALKEMVRQELQTALLEKKKKIDEVVGGLDDPNFIAGVATLLGVGTSILVPFIKALKAAKTPEEKAKVKKDLKSAIGSKMSGGI